MFVRAQPDASSAALDSRRGRWLIVADDLTGACDAAVAFAGRSASVHVALGDLRDDPQPSEGAVAVSTESRDLPANAALATLSAIAGQIPPNTQIFKKIDSVFRGNTFLEIQAAIRLFPAELVVVAPAAPSLGRRMQSGSVLVEDAAGSRTIPVAAELRDLGMDFQLIEAELPHADLTRSLRPAPHGRCTFLVDGSTEDDLHAIVRAARLVSDSILWIGSSGLAHALAAELPLHTHEPHAPHRTGEVIFFIGSDHPVTTDQLAHLRNSVQVEETASRPASFSGDCLLIQVPNRTSPQLDLIHTLSGVSVDRIGCLFITGGDTASLVCEQLGIEALTIEREVSPGVPVATAIGGPLHGVRIVLKSGGFGHRDLLCHILNQFGRKDRVGAQ